VDLHLVAGESKFMIDKRVGGWCWFQKSEDIVIWKEVGVGFFHG